MLVVHPKLKNKKDVENSKINYLKTFIEKLIENKFIVYSLTDINVPTKYMGLCKLKNICLETGIKINLITDRLDKQQTRKTIYGTEGNIYNICCLDEHYFIYDEIFISNSKSYLDYQSSTLALPMVLGVKAHVFENFVVGAEVGARYAFTDNLDGSNPENDNFANLRFGNLNSNDWYVFSGITLTYTFGQNPCFCAE
jgi:hypothetical protein